MPFQLAFRFNNLKDYPSKRVHDITMSLMFAYPIEIICCILPERLPDAIVVCPSQMMIHYHEMRIFCLKFTLNQENITLKTYKFNFNLFKVY